MKKKVVRNNWVVYTHRKESNVEFISQYQIKQQQKNIKKSTA